MLRTPWSGLLLATTVATSAVVLSTTALAAPDSTKAKVANRAYIVQMAEPAVTAYQGGIAGYAATKPRKGQKIDPNAPGVVSYMSYLTSRQDATLAAVGASKKLYSYGY